MHCGTFAILDFPQQKLGIICILGTRINEVVSQI